MTTIAVFDDHAERREALKLLIGFQKDLACIGDYEDCSTMVERFREAAPDVVLMDIHMPGIDGIEGVKLLRRHFPDVLIIMQTVFEDDDHLFTCLQEGAHGYILKKTPNAKIIEAIHEVVDGGAPMSPSIARRVLLHFGKKPAVPNNDENHNLSKRELDILNNLVKGMSHKMIAAALSISVFTVSNHIKNIYQKLQVHSVSEAVATALQKNIVG
ncbi:MAG: response regulator transcription factor [Agriterribacter sp.]